jgi:hypothetical protein
LLALFTAIALLLPASLPAQTVVAGDIAGTVTDPSNAVVSGADVTVTSTDTASTATTRTSATGSFRVASLKPGNYKISVKQSGFRTTVVDVVVAIGQVTTANVQMQVGQGSETVEVTGAAPLIQTEDANISTSFSPRQLDLLPNGGNDLTSVAQTAPGVLISSQDGNGGYGNFTAFGLPATSNLFTVNGNDEMDPYLNLNNSGATNLLLGKNEVQETAVVSNGYTGQYGRMAGAQVDYATKSGSNNLHGNAQYFYNSGGFNANDWFANHTAPVTPLPEEVNNQWAASFGGPIKKDKLFFFVDTEGLRYILGTSTLAIVPTQAYENAVVNNLAANGAPNSSGFYSNMFNVYNGAPGINRATPVDNSIDGTGNLGCGDLNVGGNVLTGLAAFGGTGFNPAYGAQNEGGGQPCANSFRSTVGQLSKEWILAARIDYNLSNSDKLFGRFRSDRGVQPTFTDPINSAFNATSSQPQDEGQLNWTHTFTPTILNQFILSGSYYSAFFVQPDRSTALNLFPYDLEDFDTSSFTTLNFFGFRTPAGRNVTQYQFIDDLSMNRGNHSLKFGGNFRRNDITDGIFGQYTDPRTIIFSRTDFSAGIDDYIRQRFPLQLEQPMAIYSFGVYLQDEWKVNNDLKLTMTLRADRNSNTVCQTNCFSNLVAPFNQLPHNANTPYNQIIQANQQQTFPDLEKVVLQPRFGFAWTPAGKSSTVVRGGLGLFSDLYPATLVDGFARNSPSAQDFTLEFAGLPYAPTEPGNAAATIQGCNTAFINTFAGGGTPASFLAAAPAGCAVPNYNSVVSKVQNPKYLEWNLELQQAIGSKTSLVLNYVGNHGYDEFIFNNAENTWSTTNFGGLPGAAPDTHFRNVSLLTNSGVSNYHGLTATVTRRLTSGFTGSLNYTWSHAQDDISNGGVLPYSITDSLLGQINPFNLRSLNYSNADYDVRHNITANYVWELPFKAQNPVLNRVVKGFTLSGTFFYHTGYPYSVFDSAAPAAALNNGTSATVLATFNGGPTAAGCNTPDTPCLLASQFAPVAGETSFGNVPRNSFRGPGYFNSDFTLLKNIPITERVSFGLGATAYNVFNHASFAPPTSNINNGQFGLIESTVVPPTSPYGSFVGSAVSGRLVQLQARLTF